MRLRKIRKWGNTHTILLTKVDLKDLNLKEGDIVNIEDIVNSKSTNTVVSRDNNRK
jgi:antitoxin component of MazEF toxin-antitoxin module